MKTQLLIIFLLITQSSNAQELLTYHSKNLPRTDSVWVFKPANYNKSQTYPLVYLLHGYSGNYKAWNKIMNCQTYADKYGFIIVCPDGLFNSWYFNSPMRKDSQFSSFFFDELLPSVNQRYHPDQRNIFISGLSMGGHGALTYFLQHLNMFNCAGSTSGMVDLRVGYSASYGIKELLGAAPADNDALWEQYSVIGNIARDSSLKKPIIFDCGTEDGFHKSNDALYRKCMELHIPATYISQPGKHANAYWAQSIKAHFDFFEQHLVK